MSQAEFDRFATSYERDLAKSLAATGEDRNFFAGKRVDWTAQRCEQLKYRVRRILDYGCGDGTNAPLLGARFRAEQVTGVDVSSASIEVARQANYGEGTSFLGTSEWAPDHTIDLAFTNGVFHHIPPGERQACLGAIGRAVRPGGLLAFWENNPWNPGTRYVMSQCAFDEHAITISPRAARKMLAEAGFKVLGVDSLFYFPRQLRLLRPAERWLRKMPLGGQYLVLCQNQSA
jgi:SAM-dependent methyltransferase